jgi:triphosphoribosyl-dephospho-CoA synthetase
MSDYEVPSEALLNEVWEAAKLLGYLTMQVDQILEKRCKSEKEAISRAMAYKEAELMRQMVQNDVSLEEYAEKSVQRLRIHMDAYAEIDASWRNNSNRFKQMVQDKLEEGKLNATISFTVDDLREDN